ncbi:RNB domain-containing ribonuclease [Serinicoccus kebangsaanensis]|uniref:RNB domain-containing ribonuclease n=1 Tax=Serinicoccus kebangsaanensis TaxID=2602069 RepID=UPI00124F1BB5|nr:RNB domain-containing ribonuclease [Serinicoccus kebangsaanensis]
MVDRATTLTCDPSATETGQLLTRAFERIREEQEVRETFPEAALAEAEQAVDSPELPDRDETSVDFITIDPPGSMDLDQAMHIARDGEGYRVRYAIADVPAFLAEGGALDAETRLRGQTIYCPDRRVPLHPPVLSEEAASLLPDADRPAYVWDIRLTDQGERGSAEIYRAMVRSRRRYTYTEVQQLVDDGEGEETLLLLKEVGELRIAREIARGGASLPMPEQEVGVGSPESGCEYQLSLRPLLPAEDWNAQISLLTGMVAARIMLDGAVGILRTMPEPTDGAVARFRREVEALGAQWPAGMPYGEFLRTLDKTDTRHLAIVNAATFLFRGAGYTAFDGELPREDEQVQSAIAAPYAHVTAPLRRLVDRFGLAVCEALSAGRDVPAWAREALPGLPDVMQETGARANAVDRACVTAVEAAVLRDRVGEDFEAVVVDGVDGGRVEVQLVDPPVSDVATGSARLGSAVTVRVERADVLEGEVDLRIVGQEDR